MTIRILTNLTHYSPTQAGEPETAKNKAEIKKNTPLPKITLKNASNAETHTQSLVSAHQS